MNRRTFTFAFGVTFLLISQQVQRIEAVTISTVLIGNPGNPPDTEVMVSFAEKGTSGYGSIGYSFCMAKTEVTIGQYVEFLNAVAASDPHLLYYNGASMGIVRSGAPGSYVYAVPTPAIGKGPGGSDYTYDDKPVRFVNWFSAIRFANWLNNGQGGPGTTEYGAYTLETNALDPSVPTNWKTITRNPGARWWLPSENEWYKAAYYDPLAGTYYDYPTGTNSVPNNNLPTNDTGNSANFIVRNLGTHFTTGSQLFPLTNVGTYTLSQSP